VPIYRFYAFCGKKEFDYTTKNTKSTKVIYFILLFLRDLRGKNKTDHFGSGLSGLGDDTDERSRLL
jgi:hypothetical protein